MKRTRKKTRSVSGLVPEGDVRLTANIREDLHLRLKIAAARQRTTIGELIELLVEKYIK
ncbi:plasmid partition protein ParG [Geobacter sp.]|uniref:plasmid partition protein ParG n=1 Tax=Geobacter sp. TaxID=46610 RepID=UPI002617CFA7|nr:plasmid partition protein ParG [Geobacter sp.]